MQRSLFTKIIDREIPATIEYEDDRLIAIRDIVPVAPVHILLIPKKPLESVNTIGQEDQELIGHIFHVGRQLAEKFNISQSGYRIVTNVNRDAGQTVHHLHFHLIGGEPLGHMTTPPPAPLPPVIHTGTLQTFWRDLAIFIVAAIGLSIGFNELNPKRIQWVRPTFTRDTLVTTPDVIKTDTSHVGSGAQTVQGAIKTPDSSNTSKVNTSNPDTATNPITQISRPVVPCFTPERGVVKEISYDQFVMFLKKPCVLLIDARIPESYQKGHIANAVNVNGTEAETPDMIQRMMGYPKDNIVLVYCDGGECELSHRVADVLKNFGYGPIYIYTGGWAEWVKKK